jgi:protocatechuate 3,4-dioxygenase beta subunit
MSRLVPVVLGFAMGVHVVACEDGERGQPGRGIDRPVSTLVESTNADSPSSVLPPSNARCPPTPVGASAESATLTLGPSPGVPATGNLGDPLVITGTVYDADCVPLADSQLNVWQTDGAGRYGPGHGTDDLECCYLQGTVQTDADGRYRLVTTMPGHYEGEARPPPAHIHAEVTAPGGGSVMTEIVFADDPYLPENPGNGYILVELAVQSGADAIRHGIADIVLER